MDIQSVIVSVKELENTKNSITEAIKSKGVASKGRFSSFESEIRSIQTGAGEDYQALVKDIENKNIFKSTDNSLKGVGKINPVIEEISNNRVKVYSIHDISNIRLKSDGYESRIQKSITSETKPLQLGQLSCGEVDVNVLNVSIEPIEAEVTNNETTITYTCNGVDRTVNMPIVDKEKANDSTIFWTSHELFSPYRYSSTNILQLVSIAGSTDYVAQFNKGSTRIKRFNKRPAIFNTLDSIAKTSSYVRAMLIFLNPINHTKQYFPVSLKSNFSKSLVEIGVGYHAGVIEIKENNLVFHYSDDLGRLCNTFVISQNFGSSSTDNRTITNANLFYHRKSMIGIAIKADGSPITEEEVIKSGFKIG